MTPKTVQFFVALGEEDVKKLRFWRSIFWGLTSSNVLESSWNVMAHGDAREGKWRGNWRMEWVASTLHSTSEHGVSRITTADAHTSAASSRLNWRPRRFKWTRPFRRKTKSGFCSCALTFQTQSTNIRAFRGNSLIVFMLSVEDSLPASTVERQVWNFCAIWVLVCVWLDPAELVFFRILLQGTADGGTVVKVLCYKSEGRWFDSRWCHWKFSLT
jgi:hypothetical protein